MRILHLVWGRKWTGAAAVALSQVEALRGGGIEAEILVPRGSPLAARFAASGWVRPALRSRKDPASFLAERRALREILARERFDLVHCHSSHDHLVALAAGVGRPPLVRSFHSLDSVRRAGVARLLSSRCGAAAFSGAHLASLLPAGRVPPLHAVLPPVVDGELFRPGPRREELLASFGVGPGAFVVGTIGKMAPGRGHDAAVRILARTRDRRVVLLQVGKGEWRDRVWELARELGAGERNFGTGYQEEMLPDLERSMDAFLFTAAGSDQGHRAVLEAMASGLPVVSLRVPGVDSLVEQGASGFLCATEEEAAARLDALARDPELRRGMSGAARRAAAPFFPPAFARSAAGFYTRVLAAGKISGPGGVGQGSKEDR